MNQPVPMVEVWRGAFLECVHFGHAVICDQAGEVVEAWGDPDLVLLPRSSAKMLQALPLVASGAAHAQKLTPAHLAVACASHQGAAVHTDLVSAWLADLGLSDDALLCGAQPPNDTPSRHSLIQAGVEPRNSHNNCSGKHAGFLVLARHLRAEPDYIDPVHPVQVACRAAFEETTGMATPGHAIDGCSAPNFATTLTGLARAMAWFASAGDRQDAQSTAAVALREAMMAHPDLVAGEGRACTELMRAMGPVAAIKTGAEGVFVAILPQQKLGIALKIADGASRASECAIAALLARCGVLDAKHPLAQKRINAPIRNWRGIETGYVRPSPSFV